MVHRDQRNLRLLRHNGTELAPIKASTFRGKKWLVSAVIPFAFRSITTKTGARIEITRTDGKPGNWTV